MNIAEARALLEKMVQFDQKPVLSTEEMDTLLELAAQPDTAGYNPVLHNVWTAGATVPLDGKVVPLAYNGYVYAASTGGITGASEPIWPTTIGPTVNDGTVVWRRSSYTWEPTWYLAMAAAEGWDWKAGKVVAQFDVQAGSVEAMRSQIYKHCIAQRDRYRRLGVGGGDVGWIHTTTEYA